MTQNLISAAAGLLKFKQQNITIMKEIINVARTLKIL